MDTIHGEEEETGCGRHLDPGDHVEQGCSRLKEKAAPSLVACNCFPQQQKGKVLMKGQIKTNH